METLQKIVTITLVMLLIVAFVSFQLNTAIAESPINYINLSLDTIPLGITYCKGQGLAYIALSGATSGEIRGIAVINVTKALSAVEDCYDVYTLTIGNPDEHFGRFVTLDDDGNIWCQFGYMVEIDKVWKSFGNLTKFDTTTKEFTITNMQSHPMTAICYIGYLWAMWKGFLQKINTTTLEVVESYNVSSGVDYGSCAYMVADVDGIWISNIQNNEVIKFNTNNNSVEIVVEEIARPLGLAIKDDIVYVAENANRPQEPPYIGNGTIAMVNKTTGDILGRIGTAEILNAGPFMVMFDSSGYLWYTDASGHVGFISKYVNETYSAISVYCYYMGEIEGHMFFTGKGSAYVGMTSCYQHPDMNDDGVIDGSDLAATAWSFGAYPEHPRWNSKVDINSDNAVDGSDLAIVAKHFGEKAV